MKLKHIGRFLLCAFCIVHCALIEAQTIDSLLDGQTLFLISPNGRYAAGCNDGTPSYFYDLEEHEFRYQLPPEGSYYTNQINDLGEVAGACGLQAAVWYQGGEWVLLPKPDGLTEPQLAWSQANAISADGNTIVVSFGETPDMHCIYQKQQDGTYIIEPLELPIIEPVYHKAPQFVSIKGISADGRRIAARYLDDDGFREVPLVFECNDEGEWSYRFLALDTLVIDGCELPHKPKRDEVDNYSDALQEYWSDIMAMETGIYYKLGGMTISANGRYIGLTVAMSVDEDDYYTMPYPAVIDVDRDSIVIFKHPGSCLSVTDDGTVSISGSTPAGVRTSYVSFLENTDSIISFGDYVKHRTSGKIDLSEIMVYFVDLNGNTEVGYGSAALAASGSAALSLQLNDYEWKYESYMISFGTSTDIESNRVSSDVSIYPNPTQGVIYFDEDVSDFKIYDLAGRQLYALSEMTNMVDLSFLNQGTYVVTFFDKKCYRTEKIVVAK